MKKNNSTKLKILETACFILAAHGYSQFTMRNIAKECRINLKSLQYYFPTKRQLLDETLELAINSYYFNLNAKFDRLADKLNSEDRFITFIKYTLRNNKSPITSKFYPELWAMSSHDRDCAVAMDKVYTAHRKNITDMILAINIDLSYKDAALLGAIIAVLLEGTILLIGDGKPKHKELSGLEKEIIKQCLKIINA